MFVDDHHVTVFSSVLKRNIVEQAASMLIQYVVNCNRNDSPNAQNNNGNAFDERRRSLNQIHRKKKDFRRTNKCNLWLSKFPTRSDTSLNRLPILIKSPFLKHRSRDYSPPIHYYPSKYALNKSPYIPLKIRQKQMTLSSNATSNIADDINLPMESFSQPFMMVHKKRLRRDYFLSTMQNCIQPPYSPNHFYAFDQPNLLKLQRNLLEKANHHRRNNYTSKRRYDDDETELHSISRSKKHFASPFEHSSPKTADHISINKYHKAVEAPSTFDEKPDINLSILNQQSEPSQKMLSHLEKILNLCGELRSLATDVEIHLNEQSISKPISPEMNDKELSLEETVIDIYNELELQPTTIDLDEKNTSPSYQNLNDLSSIHSESNKSIQLMQTESFKTKSPSITNSHTKLRTSEDICSCFLKSFLEKENCQLNNDEQEYLNELTKAYLLGREQTLREQHEAQNKFQAFLNETLPDDPDAPSTIVFDTNNNNQTTPSASPSSILFYNSPQKPPDNQLSPVLLQSKSSTHSLVHQEPSLTEMTSMKYQLFINEPIAMKTTNVLPGIGVKYAQQLADCGFSTVRRLLGFYLMIKDDQHFVIWLNNNAQISNHSAWLCTHALRAWCQTHL